MTYRTMIAVILLALASLCSSSASRRAPANVIIHRPVDYLLVNTGDKLLVNTGDALKVE